MSTEMITRRPAQPPIHEAARPSLKRADIQPLPRQVAQQAEVSRNLQGVNAGMVDFIRQNNPVAEVPVKDGSLAVAEKAGSLANLNYDGGPTVEVTASVVESNVDEIGIKPMTPLLNPERQGFRQETINDLLKNQPIGAGSSETNTSNIVLPNRENGASIAPNFSTSYQPQIGNQIPTTFIPGTTPDLNGARSANPETLQLAAAPENLQLAESKNNIAGLLPGTMEVSTTKQNQEAAIKQAQLPQTKQVVRNLIAPIAGGVSKITDSRVSGIWAKVAKGEIGLWEGLKQDAAKSFQFGKWQPESRISQTPEINFLASRGVATAETVPQVSDIVYADIPDIEAPSVAVPPVTEQAQTGNPEQIRQSTEAVIAARFANIAMNSKISDAEKIELYIKLVSQIQQQNNLSPETPVAAQTQVSETAKQQTASSESPQASEQQSSGETSQLASAEEIPVAGLLSPEKEKLELPKATADSVPNLAKNYRDFASKYDRPRTPQDLKDKKAINETVTNIVDSVDKIEFYKSIGAEPDLSLTREKQYQDFLEKVTQVVMQGLTSPEGNLQQIIYAGGRQESLLSGNEGLAEVLDKGIANYKLYNKAQKIEQQAGKSDNPEEQALHYGQVFLAETFKQSSDKKLIEDPALAYILYSNEYKINVAGKSYNYTEIRNLLNQGNLFNNQALVVAIGQAIQPTLALPEKR